MLTDLIGDPPSSELYENTRKSAAEQKRLARKSILLNVANNAGSIPCPNCDKTFHAQIGLLKAPAYSQLRIFLQVKTDKYPIETL